MQILPFFVVIPMAVSFIAVLLGKKGRVANDILVSVSTLGLLALSVAAVKIINTAGLLVYRIGSWQPPMGICLVADGFTALMLCAINIVSFFIALYAINYMERYTAKWKFYSLFMMMIAGMNGVVLTGDIFNLFIFFEITSIASYALIAFGIGSEELEASFKCAVISTVGSIFILLGIGLLYSYTSTLNMADISLTLAAKGPGRIGPFVAVLFLVGFGIKSALVPFHAWLPDAHPSAPAPISAMLSSVMIKALGVYALCRLFFNVFGMNSQYLSIFMFLGALSMVVGAVLAIAQWDLKRLLAYSSISQVGYIFLGLGTGTALGILGGLFHLFNHAIFKSLLFLNSGAVEQQAGTRDLSKMGGLSQKMPVTAKTSLIGSLSISGVPPFGGFWSKLIIIAACVQSGHYGYALAAVLVGVVTLAYFMKVQKYAFFGSLSEAVKNAKEAPVLMGVAVVALAVLCVFSGILLLPALRTAFMDFAVKALVGGTQYARLVLPNL